MEFEFDPAKSLANKAKHGIDFVEAQALWADENRLEVSVRYVDEPRCLMIGRISGKHWTAIVTYRFEDIRIISVRRARDVEIACYEG